MLSGTDRQSRAHHPNIDITQVARRHNCFRHGGNDLARCSKAVVDTNDFSVADLTCCDQFLTELCIGLLFADHEDLCANLFFLRFATALGK